MSDKIKINDLTDGQQIALFDIIHWFEDQDSKRPYYIIHGYAGTGKTFVIKVFIDFLGLEPFEVAFCSYTGASVVNMIKKGNHSATTIHKLIYYSTVNEIPIYDKDGTTIIDYKKVIITERRYELENPNIKLIVVDEYSMISDDLIEDLLSFGIKIIFLGDPGQLPPVNNTNTLMLKEPNIFFEEIVRQSEGSDIIKYADYARNLKAIPYLLNDGFQVFPYDYVAQDRSQLLEAYKWADTIIVGKNATRQKINRELRENLFFQNKAYQLLPVVGDKIVCFKNNWGRSAYSPKLDDNLPLVNGTTGYVTKIHGIDYANEFIKLDFALDIDSNCIYKDIKVSFKNFYELKDIKRKNLISDYEEFDYGYAITCHKAQGNQYEKVLIIPEILGGGIENQAKWLYTAITRAEEEVIMLMQPYYYYNKNYKKTKEFYKSLDLFN